MGCGGCSPKAESRPALAAALLPVQRPTRQLIRQLIRYGMHPAGPGLGLQVVGGVQWQAASSAEKPSHSLSSSTHVPHHTLSAGRGGQAAAVGVVLLRGRKKGTQQESEGAAYGGGKGSHVAHACAAAGVLHGVCMHPRATPAGGTTQHMQLLFASVCM